MNNRRQIAALQIKQLANDLTRVKVNLPKPFQVALDKLARIEAARPVAPTPAEISDAILAEDFDLARQLATYDADAPTLRNTWDDAVARAAKSARRALTGHGDQITTALAKLAVPHMESLTAAAAVGGSDIAALLRDGRTKDAEVVARLEHSAGELAALYGLRDRVCEGADFGQEYGQDCRYWQDPRQVVLARAQSSREPSRGGLYVLGIRAEAGLWFPTPGEANAQGAKIRELEQIAGRGGSSVQRSGVTVA